MPRSSKRISATGGSSVNAMQIANAYELLAALKHVGYLKEERDPLWWPHSGTERVVIGTILTQQTKWERVEESLAALEEAGICSLEGLSNTDESTIASLIGPSGFYNTKAVRLKQLSVNILDTYGDFTTFAEQTDREWLLSQKGIGMESADSILCYACKRPVMVVDSYTDRVLDALGYAFENYISIQEWMHEGIEAHDEKIVSLYGRQIPLHEVYARFHGKIVEFAKEYVRGKRVDLSVLSKSIDMHR